MDMNQDSVNYSTTMVCGELSMKGFLGTSKKVKMVCTCMKDGCDKDCEVFETVPDIKASDMEWYLRDEDGNIV